MVLMMMLLMMLLLTMMMTTWPMLQWLHPGLPRQAAPPLPQAHCTSSGDHPAHHQPQHHPANHHHHYPQQHPEHHHQHHCHRCQNNHNQNYPKEWLIIILCKARPDLTTLATLSRDKPSSSERNYIKFISRLKLKLAPLKDR